MNYDYDVKEWLYSTNYPITSGNPFSWEHVKYFNIHYIGSGSLAASNEISVLNGIQQDYVENRGYSFGYSSAVGLSGSSYEGRGTNYRAASNGDETNKDDSLPGNPRLLDNKEVFSCLLIIGDQDELTPNLITGVNKLISQMPPQVSIINGHRDLDATACPGDKAYKAIQSGVFHRIGDNYKEIGEMRVLETPDRIYDSRYDDDKQPVGKGITKFGMQRFTIDGAYPKAVTCTVTAIPAKPNDGYVGQNQEDSFINWKASDQGRPFPQTLVLPVDEVGEIQLYLQNPAHILITVRAYG